jgi:hypothetical protein
MTITATVRTATTPSLPEGWRELDVPAVARPVLVGPGGVVVVFARDTVADAPTAATTDRRSRHSGAELTAELVAQMLSQSLGRPIDCTPVVVIDDTATLAARPDAVPVVHRRRLVGWLADRPAVLDEAGVERVTLALAHA